MSLLQPDMIVLDEHLLARYAEARAMDADTVERPVVAVVDHFADELLAAAASSGVRGFLPLSSTPAEVARVVVAAARGTPCWTRRCSRGSRRVARRRQARRNP
ncbi:hypothetical protein [Arthrobacter sp. NamB2]|uniref:hypothetical protein n=1 Tax=Arthrobacter sp. NamB2 TaxID=2576035 RepID=UPI001671EAB1|nr:hypothetical protein [Arthrobacter sp. NamB2]